jgi:hypothetical protein
LEGDNNVNFISSKWLNLLRSRCHVVEIIQCNNMLQLGFESETKNWLSAEVLYNLDVLIPYC